MIRLAGSALLLMSCVALGLGAVNGLKERVKQLHLLVISLEEMEREIQTQLTPMPELLNKLAERANGAVGAFFSLCASGLRSLNGRPFSQLWRQALTAADLSLTQEDLTLMEELGEVLGRYDGQRQCQAIAQVKGRLEENLAAAAERRARLGRVYGTLGFAAGALLVIVLI